MYFYLIAVDYKTAPLAARENFYRQQGQINDFWKAREAAVLFTCNRIEIYAIAKNMELALDEITGFKRELPDFFNYARVDHGRIEIIRHALRLATGLESQLKGELQIFQQLVSWRMRNNLPFALDVFWQKILSLSGRIRQLSGLDRPGQNIANAIFYDIDRMIGINDAKEIVVTGTGKIAEILAANCGNLTRLNFAAHKNFKKAKELAKAAHGKALLLGSLPQALLTADVLISATSSPHFLFNKGYFSKVIFKRNKPLYIYDLAVPRDIDPDTNSLEGVVLTDLDSLSGAFNEFNSNRSGSVLFAEALIYKILDGLEEIDEKGLDNWHAAQQFSFTAG